MNTQSVQFLLLNQSLNLISMNQFYKSDASYLNQLLNCYETKEYYVGREVMQVLKKANKTNNSMKKKLLKYIQKNMFYVLNRT